MSLRGARDGWRLLSTALLGWAFAFACSVPHFEFVAEDPPRSGDDPGDGVECGADRADCDGDASDPCETNLRSHQQNCGACGNDCGEELCRGGRCTPMNCAEGTADCDADLDNGCEINLTSVDDCGACGNVCSSTHGTAGCDLDGCQIVCDDHYGDCDSKPSTGCETALAQDVDNCGACGVRCDNEHGTTSCADGRCAPLCATGYLDCNGDPVDGCEAEVATSLTECGACGATCALAKADEACDAGVCHVLKCDDGFADCDGDAKNGCEADLSAPTSCGSCSNKCSDNGGTASCNVGQCGITCAEGRADCKNGPSDGCETDLAVSATNCGECGKVCPSSGGTPACNAGVCGVSSCTAPFEDCNSDSQLPDGDGCETNLSNDALNCNGCGNACYYPNGVGRCVNRACLLGTCEAGYADCSSAPGCETRLGTSSHCRSCTESCSNAHGSTSCSAAGCVPVCALGWADCDGKPENGCETSLTTPSDCGACGQTCSKAHASASCASGSCAIANCDDGWGNCDDEASSKNGCETNLYSLTNCGGCGKACSYPNAVAACPAGTCMQGTCAAGYADCEPGAGCETALGSNSDCASCNNACSAQHGSNVCDGAPGSFACKPTCDAGFKSCDGNPDNGCEANLATASNCGNCGVKCTGSTPLCIAGACGSALVSSGTGGLIGTSGTLSFSHTLATPSGRGRVVVVVVASDGGSQASSATSGATYGNQAMQLARQIWSGSRVTVSAYYIKDAALPSPGSYTVSITGGEYVKIANVYELRGIDQGSTLEASAGSSGGDCASDDPSDAITTTTANAFIVSGVATFGSNLGSPNGAPQAPLDAYSNQAGSLGFRSGYIQNASSGARNVGWDMTSCDRSAHVLAAFRAAP